MYKQTIILRKDIEMSVGKRCVQCSHASLGAYKNTEKSILKKWESEGQKKVVLGVNSKEELINLFKQAKKEKLSCFLVEDAGLTELPEGTITALAIGPDDERKIDRITGGLKLL